PAAVPPSVSSAIPFRPANGPDEVVHDIGCGLQQRCGRPVAVLPLKPFGALTDVNSELWMLPGGNAMMTSWKRAALVLTLVLPLAAVGEPAFAADTPTCVAPVP